MEQIRDVGYETKTCFVFCKPALPLPPSTTVLTASLLLHAANNPGAGQAGGAVAPQGGIAACVIVLAGLVQCDAPTTASCCALLLHTGGAARQRVSGHQPAGHQTRRHRWVSYINLLHPSSVKALLLTLTTPRLLLAGLGSKSDATHRQQLAADPTGGQQLQCAAAYSIAVHGSLSSICYSITVCTCRRPAVGAGAGVHAVVQPPVHTAGALALKRTNNAFAYTHPSGLPGAYTPAQQAAVCRPPVNWLAVQPDQEQQQA
jgi:hypothetical protein